MKEEVKNILSDFSDIDMEVLNDEEIEIELSEKTSIVYSKKDKRFYVETFSEDEEEQYQIEIDSNNIKEIKCFDYIVTVEDIKYLIKLSENT